MLRIYLDTNVFSTLQQNHENEMHDKVLSLLSLKNNFLFCYSPAHLIDKIKAETDHRDKALAFMDLFVEQNLIQLDEKSKTVMCYGLSPQKAFSELIDPDYYADVANPFESLLSSKNLDQFPGLLEIFTRKLNFGFDKLDEVPQEFSQDLQSFIPNLTKDFSFKELLQSAVDTHNDLMDSESSRFKELRRSLVKILRLENLKIDITEPAFNDTLKNTSLGQPFLDFVKDGLNRVHKDGWGRFDHFVLAYLMLNFLGLDKEKNKKSSFSNTMHDAQHSFYAAHCDILVTDDKTMILKSKSLYNLFGLETKVYSFQEFMNEAVTLSDLTQETPTSFITLLSNELQNAFVLESILDKESNITFDVIGTNERYLGYFNRIQRHSNHESSNLILMNNSKNYSSFIFYEEMKQVTNKAIKLFGIDYFDRSFFSEIDLEEIKSKNWRGRIWVIENEAVFLLQFIQEQGRLIFQILFNE